MACKIKYTPAEFLSIMVIGFVQGQLPPAIDKQGKPVYVLQKISQETISSGCGATLVIQATANESFLKSLANMRNGTHEACPISGLRDHAIYIWDIVEFQSDPLRMCYGLHVEPIRSNCDYCSRSKERVVQFFQDIQNCHDSGALWYYKAVTLAKIDEQVALRAFRVIVLNELKLVAAKYSIGWTTVEAGVLEYGESLAERVPAIAGLVA